MQIILKQARSFSQLGMRKNQEDARYPDCDRAPEDQFVFVVCDGVGGHQAGEVASQTVCNGFATYLCDEDPTLPFRLEDFQKALSEAFIALYRKISQTGVHDMGTTFTFALFHAQGVTLAHMGDSRIYQVRPGWGLVYRSDDHSLVGELVKNGEMTPEQAEESDFNNVITRCVNEVPEGRAFPKATVYESNDVMPGDIFLLCTDGVLHCVPEQELITFLCNPQATLDDKVTLLASESASSSDNNTAFLIEVDKVIRGDDDDDIFRQTSEVGPKFKHGNIYKELF